MNTDEPFFNLYKHGFVRVAVGIPTVGSLSPRSDYRAPSDSEATVWLSQLDRIPGSDAE